MGRIWWFLPLCESLHFIGMAMLIGVVGVIDLRMLGMAKRLPLAPLQRLVPWAVLGFAINLATGLVFIAANPRQYIGPPLSLSFAAKMLFIIFAGLNAILFYISRLKSMVDRGGGGHEAPIGAQ